MKLLKKHTAGMKQYKEFKKCIGMIGKIEESADAKEAALTAGYIIGVVKERHDKRLITDSMCDIIEKGFTTCFTATGRGDSYRVITANTVRSQGIIPGTMQVQKNYPISK